jgi:hypothetical protein
MRYFVLMALAVALCSAHDMFPYESKELEVEAGKVGRWIHDQFMFVFWIVSTIIVYPLSLIAAVFNRPQAYVNMHTKVVTKTFKLSGFNATTTYI